MCIFLWYCTILPFLLYSLVNHCLTSDLADVRNVLQGAACILRWNYISESYWFIFTLFSSWIHFIYTDGFYQIINAYNVQNYISEAPEENLTGFSSFFMLCYKLKLK